MRNVTTLLIGSFYYGMFLLTAHVFFTTIVRINPLLSVTYVSFLVMLGCLLMYLEAILGRKGN